MRVKLLLFSVFFTILFPLSASIELNEEISIEKAKEIMSFHFKHKTLTPNLLQTCVVNFIEMLDPWKMYLTQNEVTKWYSLSKVAKASQTSSILNKDFTQFKELFSTFIKAIYRRTHLEALNQTLSLGVFHTFDPGKNENHLLREAVSFDKTLSKWPKDNKDLLNKLRLIKKKQLEGLKLIPDKEKKLYLQRLEKRKLAKEGLFINKNTEESNALMLSFFLKSLCQSLDTHTCYFTPEEAKEFLMQIQQKLCGIGASLRDDIEGFTIVEIVKGGPCSQCKEIQPGDMIVGVNEKNVIGLDLKEVVSLIRGKKGTKVVLTLVEENQKQPKTISIERDDIILNDSRCIHENIPHNEGQLAYVQLHSFYQDEKSSSAQDVYAALKAVNKKGPLKGVILDLRNNSGGLLSQAIEVCSLFMKCGVISSIKDNLKQVHHLRNFQNKQIWQGPLIILVNNYSASASEIVSQCLQDYGLSLIVGSETTFGKGTYQFPTQDITGNYVNPQGEYKVTRGMYYTVSGKSPQCVGIKSDIVIKDFLSYHDIGEKFFTNPLENDNISPQFQDKLSDLSLLQKIRIKKYYEKNKQTKSSHLQLYTNSLREQSAKRLLSSKEYQEYLKCCNNPQADLSLYKETDFQKTEAILILKDWLSLINTSSH